MCMSEYDVVVVGGGAAGLSAALVLSRARRTCAVIDAGQPRNAPADHMHGFLSRDGESPASLLEAGRAEIARYGAEVIAAEVTAISAHSSDGFDMTTGNGLHLQTRRVLVTTGLRDEFPDVAGARDRWGRDFLHCPYCHGYEVRDAPVGVLGGTPGAVEHAQLVRQWSSDVVFFPHTDLLTADEQHQLSARHIKVVEGIVTQLVVEGDRLCGVELADGQVIPRTAVFVRPRLVPNNALLTQLGCATDEQGWVVADRNGRTSVPGVWAAGNAVNPRAQVITAAGEGSAAAIDINGDLVHDDVVRAAKGQPVMTPSNQLSGKP
jgi:thioredoxin reductase